MGLKRTDEFRQDAVRIALTSGLTRKQVADDLGFGMPTLNKWITAYQDTDVVSKEDLDLAQENERLPRKIRLLKEDREILKKATQFFRGPKATRFKFVEEHGAASRPIRCVMSLASAHGGCVPSAAVLPSQAAI